MVYYAELTNKLRGELTVAYERVMELRSKRKNTIINIADVMDCFTRRDGRTYDNIAAFRQYFYTLNKKGFISFRPHSQGGWGVEVNPECINGPSTVRTTIVDHTANVRSKLKETKEYRDAQMFLEELVSLNPSMPVGKLKELLAGSWSDFAPLFKKQLVDITTERLETKKDLESIKLERVDFAGNEQSLKNVSLWQALRIGKVLDEDKPKEAPRIFEGTDKKGNPYRLNLDTGETLEGENKPF